MGWFKTSKSTSSSTSEPSSYNSAPTSACGSAHNNSSRWTRGFGGKKDDHSQTRFSSQGNLRQVLDADFRVFFHFQGDRRGRRGKKKDKEAASSSSPVSRTPTGYNDSLMTTRSDSAMMMVPTHPLPLPVPEAVGVSSRRPSSSSRWLGNGGGVSGEEVNGNGNGIGNGRFEILLHLFTLQLK